MGRPAHISRDVLGRDASDAAPATDGVVGPHDRLPRGRAVAPSGDGQAPVVGLQAGRARGRVREVGETVQQTVADFRSPTAGRTPAAAEIVVDAVGPPPSGG